jgi:hypothetical protein
MPLKDKRFATRAHRAHWLILSSAAQRDEVKIFADWIQAQARSQALLAGGRSVSRRRS